MTIADKNPIALNIISQWLKDTTEPKEWYVASTNDVVAAIEKELCYTISNKKIELILKESGFTETKTGVWNLHFLSGQYLVDIDDKKRLVFHVKNAELRAIKRHHGKREIDNLLKYIADRLPNEIVIDNDSYSVAVRLHDGAWVEVDVDYEIEYNALVQDFEYKEMREI